MAASPPGSYSFVPMDAQFAGPFASYGRVAVEQERGIIGSSQCGKHRRPQFSPLMPLELTGLVDPHYYSEMIGGINDFRGKFEAAGYAPLLVTLAGFAMFGAGGQLTVEGETPTLLIIGFILFALGGISNVYVKRLQWSEWQGHVTSKCSEATARFPSVRFSLQVRLAAVVNDGPHHDHHRHHHGRHGIYSSTIVVEFPLPPR